MRWIYYPVVLAAALIISSCSSSNDEWPIVQVGQRDWYFEDELAGIVPTPDKTILLRLTGNSAATEQVTHSVNYLYSTAGIYTYCLDEDDPYVAGMKLTDRAGNQLLSLGRGECGVAEILPGNVTMSVSHDPLSVPEEGTVAFISQQGTAISQPSTQLEGIESLPRYPEFRPIRVTDYNLKDYQLIFSSSGDYDLLKVFAPSDPKAANLMKQGYHLFSFQEKERDEVITKGVLYTLGNHDDWGNSETEFKCSDHPDYCLSSQRSYPDTVTLLTRVNKRWTFGISVVGVSGSGYGFSNWDTNGWLFAAPSTGYLYNTRSDKQNFNQTNFYTDNSYRAYRSADQMTSQPGEAEAAIYGGSGYSGAVFVVGKDQPDASTVYLPVIRSVKPGQNTTLVLYSEKNYMGRSQVLAMPRKDLNIDASWARSLKLLNSKKILISSRKCQGCNLANVDLSGLDLRRVNLTQALLHGANLSNSNLEGATLCKALLNGDPVLSNKKAAVLQGARLKNANLNESNTSGADFSYAGFHSSTPGACLSGCGSEQGCSSARNANIASANFSHTYMAGVDLTSANATGANFKGAVLVSANLTDAKVGRDPETSALTSFASSFIQGANFKNISAGGVSFNSAYVALNNDNGHELYFLLGGEYTRFAGYWKGKGSEACVKYKFPTLTAVPSTDSSTTCPDNRFGACSENQWKSPTTKMEDALPKASYSCTVKCYNSDDKW